MSIEPVARVTSRPDADVARELREELRPLLDQVLAVQNKAQRAGLQLGFQIARDNFGRNFVQTIEVIKPL